MPPVQVVDTIEEYFGMGNHIRIQWSHELRGFLSDEEKKSNYLADSSDLSLWVLSPLEMHSKKEVYAGMTKYQRVDIWDIVEVRLLRLILNRYVPNVFLAMVAVTFAACL